MSILTAENLAKSYKSRKVVSDVSLTVKLLVCSDQTARGKQQPSTWLSD